MIPDRDLSVQFCGHKVVKHFTDEPQVIFILTCSHVLVEETLAFASGVLILFLAFGFTAFSHFQITMATTKIYFIQATFKAFSASDSHLSVVMMYCGTAIFMYPHLQPSQNKDKIINDV